MIIHLIDATTEKLLMSFILPEDHNSLHEPSKA